MLIRNIQKSLGLLFAGSSVARSVIDADPERAEAQAVSRGLKDTDLVEGTRRSSLNEMTEWTLWADKILVFCSSPAPESLTIHFR
jgi:sulfur relay (sulfurtransferase) complex TusBCD TusD component (DsrE family)